MLVLDLEMLAGLKVSPGEPDIQWQVIILIVPSVLLVLLYRQKRYEFEQLSVSQALCGSPAKPNCAA